MYLIVLLMDHFKEYNFRCIRSTQAYYDPYHFTIIFPFSVHLGRPILIAYLWYEAFGTDLHMNQYELS